MDKFYFAAADHKRRETVLKLDKFDQRRHFPEFLYKFLERKLLALSIGSPRPQAFYLQL